MGTFQDPGTFWDRYKRIWMCVSACHAVLQLLAYPYQPYGEDHEYELAHDRSYNYLVRHILRRLGAEGLFWAGHRD